MKIFEREYDYVCDKNGETKSNKLLGDFKIIEILYEDTYSSLRIGVDKYGLIYLIEEKEVTGHNGGSVFNVIRLKTLSETKDLKKILEIN